MRSLRKKGVRLAVIPNISRDLRDPRMVHRLKRAQEQKKVAPALELNR